MINLLLGLIEAVAFFIFIIAIVTMFGRLISKD